MLEFVCNKAIVIALLAVVFVIILTVHNTNDVTFSRSPNTTKGVSHPHSNESSSTVRNYTIREDLILRQFELIPNHQIWKPHIVSEQMPFIFMHQRKAGGTSLRSTLHMAARISNLTSFIPCYGGIDCRIFSIPTTPVYAVYALHTTWSELERSVSENIQRNATNKGVDSVEDLWRDDLEDDSEDRSASDFPLADILRKPTSVPSPSPSVNPPIAFEQSFACLTNFREPVSRLMSCLYFRFDRYFQLRNLSCINDLSVARMTRLLVEKLDTYNNSCLNEPYRVLGPIDDERVVTSLGYDYNNITYEVRTRYEELELTTLNATLHNLQRCVPVALELPHSYRLLKVAFPSLHKSNAFDHQVREQTGFNYSRNCTAPTAAHLHVLRELTSFESVLYGAVVKKVQSAIAGIDGKFHSHEVT